MIHVPDPNAANRDPRLMETPSIGLPFVSKDIALGRQDEGARESDLLPKPVTGKILRRVLGRVLEDQETGMNPSVSHH